ncbi:hypothetical protein HK097_011294 [Rhizophlyctis rosea]|uniref:Uncharacterized protein n=1 Tax=Rhizophlyctis rosea TaxID=64517 RepID=A0AAD5S6L9_9FUNG|nr:hypothetical protein HK097_011294 [Rhizophlyctis rosea]
MVIQVILKILHETKDAAYRLSRWMIQKLPLEAAPAGCSEEILKFTQKHYETLVPEKFPDDDTAFGVHAFANDLKGVKLLIEVNHQLSTTSFIPAVNSYFHQKYHFNNFQTLLTSTQTALQKKQTPLSTYLLHHSQILPNLLYQTLSTFTKTPPCHCLLTNLLTFAHHQKTDLSGALRLSAISFCIKHTHNEALAVLLSNPSVVALLEEENRKDLFLEAVEANSLATMKVLHDCEVMPELDWEFWGEAWEVVTSVSDSCLLDLMEQHLELMVRDLGTRRMAYEDVDPVVEALVSCETTWDTVPKMLDGVLRVVEEKPGEMFPPCLVDFVLEMENRDQMWGLLQVLLERGVAVERDEVVRVVEAVLEREDGGGVYLVACALRNAVCFDRAGVDLEELEGVMQGTDLEPYFTIFRWFFDFGAGFIETCPGGGTKCSLTTDNVKYATSSILYDVARWVATGAVGIGRPCAGDTIWERMSMLLNHLEDIINFILVLTGHKPHIGTLRGPYNKVRADAIKILKGRGGPDAKEDMTLIGKMAFPCGGLGTRAMDDDWKYEIEHVRPLWREVCGELIVVGK